MNRRYLAVALIVLAAAPLIWALRAAETDPRRAAAAAGIAIVGVAANLLTVSGARVSIHPLLRGLALAMLAIMLAAMLLAWRHIQVETLPQLPRGNHVARAEFSRLAASLLVLAGTVIYVFISVAFIAVGQDRATPSGGREGR